MTAAQALTGVGELAELDSRTEDGITVTLLWLRGTKVVVLAVEDRRTGRSFELDVQPDLALDAFRHPFAYAALRGVLDQPEPAKPADADVQDPSQTRG
jgi:hypothetical protein